MAAVWLRGSKGRDAVPGSFTFLLPFALTKKTVLQPGAQNVH